MLVHLHKSLLIPANKDLARFQTFVDALIHHVRHQHHLVVADPELLQINGADQRVKSAIMVLSKNRAQGLSITGNLKRYIVVTNSSKEIELRGNELHLSYNFILLNMYILDQAIIISESNRDSRFYIQHAHALIHDLKSSAFLSQSFFKFPGGGGTTYSNFEDICNSSEKRLVICIVDSDKACEDCDVGSTAALFVAPYDRGISCVYILNDHREIENLLSPEHVCATLNTDEIDVYVNLSEDRKRFIDLKSQIKTNKLDCGHGVWDSYEGTEIEGKSASLKDIIQNIDFNDIQYEDISAELKCISELVFSWGLNSSRCVI